MLGFTSNSNTYNIDKFNTLQIKSNSNGTTVTITIYGDNNEVIQSDSIYYTTKNYNIASAKKIIITVPNGTTTIGHISFS